jgi:hypothetical protein
VSGLHPFWTLIPVSILVGLGLRWLVDRLSDRSTIRETKRRIEAHLHEFRLFVDEPKLIWQAQVGLLRDNLRYLKLMLVPAVVLTLPMVVLFGQLEAFYGWEPLRPNQSAIVTVQLKVPVDPKDPPPVVSGLPSCPNRSGGCRGALGGLFRRGIDGGVAPGGRGRGSP